MDESLFKEEEDDEDEDEDENEEEHSAKNGTNATAQDTKESNPHVLEYIVDNPSTQTERNSSTLYYNPSNEDHAYNSNNPTSTAIATNAEDSGSHPSTTEHGHQQQQQHPQDPAAAAATTTTTTTTDASSLLPEPTIIEEKDHIAAVFVGRVIGKGGEMIRDLQARAGCRIDVDQNVPDGAPRVITFRGPRAKVDFAKRLVRKNMLNSLKHVVYLVLRFVGTICVHLTRPLSLSFVIFMYVQVVMLCDEGKRDIDLPLGEAAQNVIQVPANVIGKIIGRGGEMIRELQNKSQAKIQVHHAAGADLDPSLRRVTVTGTRLSVTKAEEMINFLTSNPAMDAMTMLNMLIEEKTLGRSEWGAGPPYASMPNGGVGMQVTGYGSGFQDQPQYGGYYGQQAQQHYGAAAYTDYFGQAAAAVPAATGGGVEMESVPCPRIYMGRVIGQKGSTINDLQKRSGCDIQINQDVAPGQDCQITIKGTRQGIELAKQMLNEVIEMGPGHPYAGGRKFIFLSLFFLFRDSEFDLLLSFPLPSRFFMLYSK